jgi:nucleoside-diphosphate-sugar epimerase
MVKKDQTILVTGGAGYIGSVLVRELLKEGYGVRVFDALYFGKQSLSEIEDRIEIIQGDVRRFPESVLKGCSAVIHMGSLSNDPTADFDPKANHEINCEGTRLIAEACKKAGVKRMTFASSAAVYGFQVGEIANEDAKTNPQSEYSRSKLDAERVLLSLADGSFCPVILRQATVYGLSSRMRWDLVVNTMTKDAFSRNKIAVFCEGENWRPLVSVNDVARAHIRCMEAPQSDVHGQIFNLVHDNLMILELAGVMKAYLHKKKKIEVDVVSGEKESRSYRISGEKMKKVLGFEPRLSIGDAVNEIYSAVLMGRYADFENPIYYNIKWMKLLAEKASMQDLALVR